MVRYQEIICWERLVVFGCFVGSAFAGGCGNGKAERFTTAVERSRPLASLTEAEHNQFCADTSGFSEAEVHNHNLQELDCRYFGILSASDPSLADNELQLVCGQEYDSCVVQDVVPTLSPAACNAGGITCSSTVTEYAACISDYFAWATSFLVSLPGCDALTRAHLDTIEATWNRPLPASCKSLDSRCPDGGLLSSLDSLFGGTLNPRH